MKGIVLDAAPMRAENISFDVLASMLDELIVCENSTGDLSSVIGDADVVFTNKCRITREVIENCPYLKYIGEIATGYNNIDIQAAKEHGILVTNVPAYSTASVVQMTFALLMTLTNYVQLHSDSVHRGDWVQSEFFCYQLTPQIELAGKTIGIIGFGDIGIHVAKAAEAFGMNILVYSRTKKPEYESECLKFVDLDTLFEQSDIVSLHCPLNAESENMICMDKIKKMKKTAFLINTARGGLVCEQDLADALNQGLIAGAGLDVLSTEPPKEENPLLGAVNCIITPHIAWGSNEAKERLLHVLEDNLKAWLQGNPAHVVNP